MMGLDLLAMEGSVVEALRTTPAWKEILVIGIMVEAIDALRELNTNALARVKYLLHQNPSYARLQYA